MEQTDDEMLGINKLQTLAKMLGIEELVEYEEYELVELAYEDCDNDDEMIAEYCKLPMPVLEKMFEKEEKVVSEKLKRYEEICQKLGCEPRDYVFIPSGYEDDSKPNPFSVLSKAEKFFLYNEGFLDEKQKK